MVREPPNRPEIVDVRVREIDMTADRPGIGQLVAGSLLAVGARGARTMARLARGAVQRVATGPAGDMMGRAASSALGTTSDEGIRELHDAVEAGMETLAHIISITIPRVVHTLDLDALLDALDIDAVLGSIDIDRLMARIDVDAILARVDVDGVLDRVDVDGLIERVDIDGLLAKVDMDRLLARADIDRLMERVDLDAVLARIDFDRVLERIDLDGAIERIDVEAIVVRAKVGNIVARSTGQVAGSALDVGRRQAVGVDALVLGIVNRLLSREPDTVPNAPPVLTDIADEESS